MITKEEFAKRRKYLMKKMGKDSVAIITAKEQCLRNGDVHYSYRQQSDFYYLTGFSEPDAIAVLIPGRAQGEYILFNRPHDPVAEKWDGPRAGQDGARKHFGANAAYPISDFKKMLIDLLQNRDRIYYCLGTDKELDEQLVRSVDIIRTKSRAGVKAPQEFVEVRTLLHEMRLIKSSKEIALMRKAAEISAQAHSRAMRICKPGMKEYEIEAEIQHEFTRNGSRAPAYGSIVGSGNNACVLHYQANNATLQDNDLILIDAGCEYQNYASDITRTFPINGRFSPEQRAIYEIVLQAQLQALKQIRPGNAWHKVQLATTRVITEGLVALGILRGKVSELIAKEAYRPFYMHHFGHWLGLDVHDAGSYKENGRWRTLLPGMVLTVEPGIYIPSPCKGVAKKWWGIGIRIEDDVVVTAKGYEILSVAAPKTIPEIERMMAK